MRNDKPLDMVEVMLSPNVAGSLSDDYLAHVGATVVYEYDTDKASRREWEDLTKKAMDLANLKHEVKSDPWPGASNVKYPLISTAIIQYTSRAIPEIVRGNRVVEVAVVGRKTKEKEDRARRVSKHMSHQLLVESADWATSLDKLIHLVATVGIAHKKTYYDPIRRKNVSELLDHDEFVVNKDITSLDEARRATHILHLHRNEIVANVRSGLYTDLDVDELEASGIYTENSMYQDDNEGYHEVLEQHRYLDLDDDGYEEPYIVTVHRSSGKVLRIVARFDPDGVRRNIKDEIIDIKPVKYFTDFHQFPSLDGSYYSLGFGTLLYSLNDRVNTIVNQLIDAGTLANLPGGFIGKGLRMKGGILRHRPGEYKMLDSAIGADINRNIVNLPYKEPSAVLLQLLNQLIDTTEKLSSVSDSMVGRQQPQNVSTQTTLSLLEQGLTVFSSLHKRLHASLKKEFEKLYRLNRLYLDPEVYFNTVDEQGVVLQEDYEDKSLDIRPVSDPNMGSNAQRAASADGLLQMLGMPGMNTQEIITRVLDARQVREPEKLFLPPGSQGPSVEQLEVQLEQAKLQSSQELELKKLEQKEMELGSQIQMEAQKLELQKRKTIAEIEEIKSRAIDNIARAEAAEAGTQISAYKAEIEALKVKTENLDVTDNKADSEDTEQ